MDWLAKNGYQTPASAEAAIRYYVESGWVFVASKVRCDSGGGRPAALHPLAFTFHTPTPVYPTRLTAVDNGDCVIDLYVFGNKRAAARHFNAVRCDRIASRSSPRPSAWNSSLRLADAELLSRVGDAEVGTKLSGKLSPRQMETDTPITWGTYWPKGSTVYSSAGAFTIALNVTLPLLVLAGLLVGASSGGWRVDNQFIRRWRWRLATGAILVGIAVFLYLPKVEVAEVSRPASGELD